MPGRAIDLWIFDADDTLRRTTVPGRPCPYAPTEWELLPGVAERLRGIPWNGSVGPWLGIASNQDRVGYGHLSEQAARRLLRDMARAAAGVELPDDALQLCPHRADAGCDCHKPRPGMLRRLMAYYAVPADRTIFVGDSPTDREAAAAAGVAFLDAATWLSSSDAPSARRSRRTPPPPAADSCGAAAPRRTRA
jgi:D-glycero-D-manno-heptose 1,7-bisphosphate phosphatase